jgi:hypothetical protein
MSSKKKRTSSKKRSLRRYRPLSKRPWRQRFRKIREAN